jgi:hypothetical protein
MQISRRSLRKKWVADNPSIPYSAYEKNYGLRMLEMVDTFTVTEDDKPVLTFTNATAYFDKRKPNEIQTTD